MAPAAAASSSPSSMEIMINSSDNDHHDEIKNSSVSVDYFERAQWVRAAVLGANDGLVSVTSLMMGVGAVKTDVKPMLLAGFAGLIAGACSMAIGEFVSVYTQCDIQKAQIKRDGGGDDQKVEVVDDEEREKEKEKVPSPIQAAVASGVAFGVGAIVPLVAVGFISEYKTRVGVVVAVASLTLTVFGGVGAVLGKTPVVKSCLRVLFGGLLAMAITFALTKLIGSSGLL